MATALPNAQSCEESGRTSTPASRFIIDAEAGTVIDKKTGLMWERCFHGLTGSQCNQYVAKLTIEEEASDNPLFYALTDGGFSDELAKTRQANSQNHLGYNDWRLPSTKELMQIVDTQCYEKLFNDERKPEGERNEVPFFNPAIFPISNDLIGSVRSIFATTPEAIDVRPFEFRIKGVSLYLDDQDFGQPGGLIHSTGPIRSWPPVDGLDWKQYKNQRAPLPSEVNDYQYDSYFYRGVLKLVRSVTRSELNAQLTANSSQ
jgi:hypothetical protein